MTAMITVERIRPEVIRIVLTADITIRGSLSPLAGTPDAGNAPKARPATAGTVREPEFLTVEQTADLLGVGRDKVYYLIRTDQLRSIKIGKLRRISREWISEFTDRLAASG
jgi:excisionase family DNA binding protein